MFAIGKNDLKESIHLLQRKHCGYDGLFKERAPSFCDCKYGFNSNEKFGENTGCPELRLVYAILSAMTDEEYVMIVNRAGGIL